jgi:hypothetical protein
MSKPTEQEISQEQLSTMIFDTMRAKTILANQNALAHNEALKRTPVWKGDIKKHGNPFVLQLIKAERNEFSKVQTAEDTLPDFKGQNVIDQAFERSNKIIHLLAKMVFVYYDDIETVLTALARDKSSVLGICKKILR